MPRGRMPFMLTDFVLGHRANKPRLDSTPLLGGKILVIEEH
jgi:hypothetical protein